MEYFLPCQSSFKFFNIERLQISLYSLWMQLIVRLFTFSLVKCYIIYSKIMIRSNWHWKVIDFTCFKANPKSSDSNIFRKLTASRGLLFTCALKQLITFPNMVSRIARLRFCNKRMQSVYSNEWRNLHTITISWKEKVGEYLSAWTQKVGQYYSLHSFVKLVIVTSCNHAFIICKDC